MTRWYWLMVAALWLGVLSSALGVTYVTFEARTATRQLEVLRQEAAALHVQSGQFLLERSSLAAYGRVEDIAMEQLGMVVPGLEQIIVVKP